MESLDRRQFLGFVAMLAAAFGVKLTDSTSKKRTVGSKIAAKIRDEFTGLSWAEREKLFKEGIRVVHNGAGVTLVIFENGPVPNNLIPDFSDQPRKPRTKTEILPTRVIDNGNALDMEAGRGRGWTQARTLS